MPGALPTTLSILTAAMRKLGALGAGETAPSGEDTEFLLGEYNDLLGQFNTRAKKAYFTRFQSFTFTTAQASYTIGTAANGANFVVSAGDRPVRIEAAQIVLTDTTPNSFINIPVWNWPEYTLLALPGQSGSWPIAIYYEPATPNGIIYPYYASPTQTAYQIRLWWWNQLETVAIADIATTLNLPPGLERALKLSLAEAAWLAFPKRTDLEESKRQARHARADFESLNAQPRQISSTDGIQTEGGTFDYRSRSWI